MIQESARNYAREKLLPRVTEAYQSETFDKQIMNEMGKMGFLGCTIQDFDLPGVSSVAYGKCKLKWHLCSNLIAFQD